MPALDQAKAIIATADPALFTALAQAAPWNPQHAVRSLTQLWQEVSTGQLDPASQFVLLAGDLPEGDAAVAGALAAIPATARLVYAETRPGSWPDVEALLVRQAAGAPAPVTVLFGDPTQMAAQLRAALGLTAGPVVGTGEPAAPLPAPSPAPIPAAAVSRVTAPAVAAHAAPDGDDEHSGGRHSRRGGNLAANFAPALIAGDPLPDQETIVVVSSKGGCGKSTTSLSVGAAIGLGSRRAMEQGLTDRAARIVIVDMDIRDGQLGTLAGVYTPTALTIRRAAHVDEHTIRSSIIPTEHLGVDVLLAPNRPRAADDIGPVFYRSLIRALKRMYDVVILDGSVNYLDPLLGGVCMPEATRILLVTTPFSTSVKGVSRALAEMTESVSGGGLGVPRSKVGLVINQATGDIDTDQRELLAATQAIEVVASVPDVPQPQMLAATNSARLDKLLSHPLLGPAYFEIARRCVPAFPLVEFTAETDSPAPGEYHPVAAAPVAPVLVAPIAPAHPAAAPDSATRRGLFSRRGR